MSESREQQALEEFSRRANRGTYLHFPMWLLMGFCVDMPVQAPVTFWVNSAVFALFTGLRMFLFLRAGVIIKRHPALARAFLQALIFSSSLHWSLLSVLSIPEGTLHPLMLALQYVTVGLATAGTVVLAIDRTVQIWLPIAALLPTGIACLLEGRPMSALYASMVVFLIVYLSVATRLVHDSYWTALEARDVLEKRTRSLESLSVTDALTQIPNRLFFEQCLENAWSSAYRERHPLSLLIIDLDHFKTVNDTYGHTIGDDCLRAAAQALQSCMVRETDRVARWGGEEFIVLLSNVDREAALFVAQRLLRNIAETQVPYPGGIVRLTCSIGIATHRPEDRRRPRALINEADKALYKAKKAGRNRAFAAAA